MEPLKPQERMALLDLGADPAEVVEYESLLAARFAEDPDAPPPAMSSMDDDEAKADEAIAEAPAGEPDFSLQLGSFAAYPAEPEPHDTLTRGLHQRLDSLDGSGAGDAKAARRRASPQQRLEQLTRKLFPGGIKQG